MRPSTRRRISLFVEALGVGAVIGALIGSARGVAFHPAPLPGAILGGVARVYAVTTGPSRNGRSAERATGQ